MRTGRIYKIITTQSNECYVGSTFNTVRDRFKGHKKDHLRPEKSCSSSLLFDKHGIESCRAIMIKEYEVLDRRHLEGYELLWIKKLGAINKIQPLGNILKKQRHSINEKEKRRQGIDWESRNKERVKLNKKAHYETVKEDRQKYYHEKIEHITERKKRHYEANKDTIKQNSREYYKKNKDAGKEPVLCEICQRQIQKRAMTSHVNKMTHQTNMTKHYFQELPFAG